MIASSTEKIKSARTLAFEALYEIFEKNAEGFCQLMNIQPENVKRCKDCKVNLFCWSCLEDIELHIKDEAAFLRRCENKKKILYQILWD